MICCSSHTHTQILKKYIAHQTEYFHHGVMGMSMLRCLLNGFAHNNIMYDRL